MCLCGCRLGRHLLFRGGLFAGLVSGWGGRERGEVQWSIQTLDAVSIWIASQSCVFPSQSSGTYVFPVISISTGPHRRSDKIERYIPILKFRIITFLTPFKKNPPSEISPVVPTPMMVLSDATLISVPLGVMVILPDTLMMYLPVAVA